MNAALCLNGGYTEPLRRRKCECPKAKGAVKMIGSPLVLGIVIATEGLRQFAPAPAVSPEVRQQNR